MRPRKPVLLFCSSLPRLSIAAYVLETRCTWARITNVSSLKDAEALSGNQFDCVVLMDGRGVENLIGSFDPARVILVSPTRWLYRVTQAGRRVPESDVAALLEAMKLVAQRKRGPKSRVELLQEAA